MNKSDLLEENKQKIIELYNQNISISKISRLIDVSPVTISTYLKKWGIQVVNKQNLLSFNLETDIIPLYKQGISLSKIAKQFNTTGNTLSRKLKEAGYEIINHQNETKFNEHIFDCIDTEEKAYWLGFIFADGYIDSSPLDPDKKSRYQFEISLSEKDINHLYKFNKFMEHRDNNVKIGKSKCPDKIFNRCRWSIVNKNLWNTLNSYGCTPQKSLTLKFPNESIFKDKSLIKHFIRGYFDGDGCLSYFVQNNKVKPKASLLGTYEFLLYIKDFLQSLNISSPNIHKVKDKQHYELIISIPSTMLFLETIYENSNIFLDRKLIRYNNFKTCRSNEQLLELLQGKNGEG